MQDVLIFTGCGCGVLFAYRVENPFIAEYSNTVVGSDGFAPFITEQDNELYFVNEQDMADPIKFSEVETANAVNSAVLFVGIHPDGLGGFVNYNYTPDILTGYILDKSLIEYTVTEQGGTITSSEFIGKKLMTISDGNQTYIRTGSFTQSDDQDGDGKGDTITMTNLVEYAIGQSLIITAK